MKRPKNLQKLCKACFFLVFETEIHNTITDNKLFHRGEKVAIGASGGKDLTVLALIMKTLNERYDYGLELVLLLVDEGIRGYRDDSLATVKRNQVQYEMPLKIVSYGELYGWTMDEIVGCAGVRSSCTYCGVLRRQALDRGAAAAGIGHVITGHNADDVAETVLMNVLRGDVARLESSTRVLTALAGLPVRRLKPFKYAYQKEIVLYAHYKKLDYFSTECTYAPEAFRGTARELLKQLAAVRPTCILDIIHLGEHFVLEKKRAGKGRKQKADRGTVNADGSVQVRTVTSSSTDGNTCERCGYITLNRICKACVLLLGLEKSRAAVSIDGAHDGAAAVVRKVEALSF